MSTTILKALALAAIGVGLVMSPAQARDHHRGDYWWDKAGYSGSNAYEDEYRYPGIRWYDDCSGGWHNDRRRHRGHGRHHHHHGEWRYDRERNDWR